jgi:hypothetical protein
LLDIGTNQSRWAITISWDFGDTMLSKSFRSLFVFVITVGVLLLSSYRIDAQVSTDKSNLMVNALTAQTGTIYIQPVDPNGKLLLSSWLDPDGSDNDQYIWDNFTLQSNTTITEIEWFGVYDPIRFGAGGPVIDFSVSIYPSSPAGIEPAVANPPLVQYQTNGNAGEASNGTVAGGTVYAYKFSLPTPFVASAGVKYWVQIEAFQQGSLPDWCLVTGSGGDGNHFRKIPGAGGDVMYRAFPGDAAFAFQGFVTDMPTPTPAATATLIPTDVPTLMPTETTPRTPTPMPPTPPCFSAAIALIVGLFLFRLPQR